MVSANNPLAWIHYITNYATKDDCSRYQRIIGATFVKKAHDANLPTVENLSLILDKFALKAFNCLAYDCDINDALVASYLFGLLDNYTLSDNVRFINLGMIQRQFLDFALRVYQHTFDVDNLVRLRRK